MEDEHWDSEERYTIGFTENQYQSSGPSPTPADPVLGYTSPALEYAERSNKGQENIYQGQKNTIERQRSKSVHKIHADILNLVFELTERRKSATPLSVQPLTNDLKRCNSPMSSDSGHSFKSSSSLPLIEVQQLPPLKKASFSLPSLTTDTFNFNPHKTYKSTTDVSIHDRSDGFSPRKNDKDIVIDGRDSFRNKTKTKDGTTEQRGAKTSETPRLVELVNEVVKVHAKEKQQKMERKDKNQNLSFERQTKSSSKWNIVAEKVIGKQTETWAGRNDKLRRHEQGTYRGRYHTPAFEGRNTNNKLSFCQSSFSERSEKERIDNVRRRHVTQTKIGPVDFNKLRRQLVTTRSNTVVW